MRNSLAAALTVGAVLNLAACGSQAVAPGPSHRASPLSSASASPTLSTSASASATSSADSSVLNCRLPLVRLNADGTPGSAGFLTFPGASFSVDPHAGAKSEAYDRVFGKWLPVGWRWVSPDGSHYAYGVYPTDSPSPGVNSTIHVVDVSSGVDRVLLTRGQYLINDFEAGGIYLTAWVGGHDGPGPQIGWVLNPTTGVLTALSGGQKYGYRIGSGAGWRDDYNTADPTVHEGMTGSNREIRVDLKSGAETTWFYRQGVDGASLVGFDRQGYPIINSVVGTAFTTWSVVSPNNARKLFSGYAFGSVTADPNGLWFSDGQATYLYDSTHGVRKMAAVGGSIAGGCH
jgi:hypothetical protein